MTRSTINSRSIEGIGSIDATGTVTAAGLTVDTDTLHIDSTNNRVGIGTGSPKRNVHLHNTASTTTKIQITNGATGSSTDGDGFQIGIGNDGTASIEQRENVPMTFSTNNTERMRITSSGRVGIGGVPTELLYLEANNPEFTMQAASDGGECAIYFKDDEGNKDGRITYRTDYAGQTDNFMQFFTNNSEKMRITAAASWALASQPPRRRYI